MLLAIRDKAQGWLAWAIVIFISIPFALWGIQSYLDVGSAPVAAEINGVEITEQELERRTRNYRSSLRSRLGDNYQADLFDDKLLRQQMLAQMIEEVVVQNAAVTWGLRAGDQLVREGIRTNPAFQGPEGFSMQSYDITLRNNGLSQAGYEETVRQELVQRQFVQGIQGSAFVTLADKKTELRLQGQKRQLSFVSIPAEKFVDQVEINDTDLQEYFRANANSYRIPERVKVEYLMLDMATVAAREESSDEQLRDYYASHKDEFQVPDERRVSHILINLAEDAAAEDVAVVQARADALFEKLQSGEDFAALAKEFSEDPGSADQGGDLGWMNEGMMPDTFETAAFALALNGQSEPVRTPFGIHLIKVVELRSGGDENFETLKEDIEKAFKTSQAESEFFELAERLADLSYEAPDSLIPAAEALGLEIKTSDWFDHSGTSGDLSSPRIVAAAFSDDVLDQGNNSELIELEEEQVLVLRVIEHEVEQTRAFDAVSDEVEQALTAQKSAILAKTEGERLLAELAAGKQLAEMAANQGWELQNPGLVGRGDVAVPVSVSTRAFEIPRPEEGSSSHAGVSLNDGGYAVLVVNNVQDGDISALDTEAMKIASSGLDGRLGQQEYMQLTSALREVAKIKITPSAPAQ